jgi:hypothetical protein
VFRNDPRARDDDDATVFCMTVEPCPSCGIELTNMELALMDAKLSFPTLGRELREDSPSRVCLQVFTCQWDGSRWARWHDRPADPLRQIEMSPKTVRWVE